jgi:hypothetical protein
LDRALGIDAHEPDHGEAQVAEWRQVLHRGISHNHRFQKQKAPTEGFDRCVLGKMEKLEGMK